MRIKIMMANWMEYMTIFLIILVVEWSRTVSCHEECQDSHDRVVELECDESSEEGYVIVIDAIYFGYNHHECSGFLSPACRVEASDSVYDRAKILCNNNSSCSGSVPHQDFPTTPVCFGFRANHVRIMYHCVSRIQTERPPTRSPVPTATFRPGRPDNTTTSIERTIPDTSVSSTESTIPSTTSVPGTQSTTDDTASGSRTEATGQGVPTDSTTNSLVLPVVLSVVAVVILVVIVVVTVICLKRRKQEQPSASTISNPNYSSSAPASATTNAAYSSTTIDMLPPSITPSAPPAEPNVYDTLSTHNNRPPDVTLNVYDTPSNNNSSPDEYAQVQRGRRNLDDTELHDNLNYQPVDTR